MPVMEKDNNDGQQTIHHCSSSLYVNSKHILRKSIDNISMTHFGTLQECSYNTRDISL